MVYLTNWINQKGIKFWLIPEYNFNMECYCFKENNEKKKQIKIALIHKMLWWLNRFRNTVNDRLMTFLSSFQTKNSQNLIAISRICIIKQLTNCHYNRITRSKKKK